MEDIVLYYRHIIQKPPSLDIRIIPFLSVTPHPITASSVNLVYLYIFVRTTIPGVL